MVAEREVKPMANTSLLLLQGDEDKVNDIVSYIDTYGVDTSDIVDFIYSELFKGVEE